MDFFENQERAQRNTGRLVALFVLGLLATVASTHLLVAATVGGGRFGDPGVLALSLGSSLVIVALGAGVKFAQMSQGGRAVAEAVGGRQIDPGSADPDERRVLNVVEEMAIASGVRVPPVYVLEDDGINAFAAGNSQQDSVVAVTRGCIRELTRDELQGVVAHEFSHIFHRDTVLNMRLVGFLGGICAISIVGRTLLRFGGSVRDSRDRNGGGVALLGLGLFLIGICGYFFGRIIQCAVSRQREFLADASAVQYTRNPDGIAGALEKIAAGAGSRLAAPAAAEFSHFYFAQGVASIFADHPPLAERIARIRGMYAVAVGVEATRRGAAPAGAAAAATADVVSAASLRSARGAMGAVTPREMDLARGSIASIPAALLDAARSPFGARAVVCRMILSDVPAERTAQLRLLADADPKLAEATDALSRLAVRPADRVALLDLSAAALTLLSPAQYADFRTLLGRLIATDGQVDRLEWTVRVLLRAAVEGRGATADRGRSPTPEDAAMVVSVLAWAGAEDGASAAQAWAAARRVDADLPGMPLPAERCTLDALDASLRALAGAAPMRKRSLVDACVACVAADGRTTVEEAELLRAICASVGAPMPPVAPVA